MCVAIIIALPIPKKKEEKAGKTYMVDKKRIVKRKEYTRLNILNEMKRSDPKDFQNYFRMKLVVCSLPVATSLRCYKH